MSLHLLDELCFGKHRGQLVVEVIENNPSYLAWAVRNSVIELDNEAYERLKKTCESEGVEL